jgi:hypothetical protein
MALRKYEDIRKSVLRRFQYEFPGEKVSDSPFAIYVLHLYCEMVELHELFRYIKKTGKEQ